VPRPFGTLLVTLYHFLAQTFFLGGTGPSAPALWGGIQNVPLTLRQPSTENLDITPPTPYTLSPLFKGGEGRGKGGSYTHVPGPFGTLLATLYHFEAKAFLMGRGDGRALTAAGQEMV
jgi:hypothetical protein